MSLPVIKNIVRVRGEVAPDVVVVAGADLTGHTADLVVETSAGVVVDTMTQQHKLQAPATAGPTG